MDPYFPNIFFNLEDDQQFSNYQANENSKFSPNPSQFSPNTSQFTPNPSQFSVTENLETSQYIEKQPRGDKWDTDGDIALMSAYCIASEDSVLGKNQKRTSLWARVKEIYDATQAENPEKLVKRNINQMRGRYQRLNENANKWIAAYREAYRQKRSGVSMKYIENKAQKIYEAGGNKFNDLIVYNEVMCKHPKWKLLSDLERTHTHHENEVDDEESGGSTKRSRTSEEGGYIVHSNPELSKSGGSTIQRPIGRLAAKNKGKGKVSNDFVSELRELRLSRDVEVEVMREKLKLEKENEQNWEEKERIKEQREIKKMQHLQLNILLAKEHMSPQDE